MDLKRPLPEEFVWIIFIVCARKYFWMENQSFEMYPCLIEPENAETEPVDVEVSEGCL